VPASPPTRFPHRALFFGLTLLLFLIWSNSFIAIGWLLGSEVEPARLDWVELTICRFAPATPICALYCFVLHRRESVQLVREHWRRLLLGGFCAVPAYNFALYYGQSHGVPAPVASILTATSPLFLMINSRLFLGERLDGRKIRGFLVSLAGLVVIASTRPSGGAGVHALAVAITVLAPLSWSFFSVASKPVVGRVSPVLWTFLALVFGGTPLFLALPFRGGAALLALDSAGWLAILFLAIACTLLGFSLWVWILRHIPASSAGFAVFLNPPLTALSKVVLAALWPLVFRFEVSAREWLGGAIVLAGTAIALLGRLGPGVEESAPGSGRTTLDSEPLNPTA
jgi:O-acetylserine/cysteine efflux transporter